MLATLINHRRCLRGKSLTLAASLLGACSAPTTPAADTPARGGAAALPITAITLERGCFGCASSALVLRRDGTATFTVTGNARQATVDKRASATVPAGEFDRLAQLVAARGFFALNESYEEPDIQDGPWTTTTVARAGQEKRVFRRNDAGPDALKEIERAIDGVKAQMAFAP